MLHAHAKDTGKHVFIDAMSTDLTGLGVGWKEACAALNAPRDGVPRKENCSPIFTRGTQAWEFSCS